MALSILMTTASTLAAIFTLPLLTSLLLGTMVAVDPGRMLASTVQVGCGRWGDAGRAVAAPALARPLCALCYVCLNIIGLDALSTFRWQATLCIWTLALHGTR
jgi:hypothetical protein